VTRVIPVVIEANWSFSPCTITDTQAAPSGTEAIEQATSAPEPLSAPLAIK